MDIDSTQATPLNRKCPTCGFIVGPDVAKCPRDGTSLVKAAQPAVQTSDHIVATKDGIARPIDRTEEFRHDAAFHGKYEFLGTLGSGGMGVIYKARQIILDKLVAIKMVHSHLVSPESFKRFQLEGKAAGLLSHPYIISVHDFDITESGTPYMIMDYVDGKTLSEVLAKETSLTIPRFLRIFIQVCDALSHAHHRSVLHRDIKPSNIMLVKYPDGHEEVRIMDFGIAKLLNDGPAGENLTKTGEAVGSPIYMSPEQARGSQIDARTDLYSLGCVMYEALVGSPPFIGKTQLDTMMMHINENPKRISTSMPAGKKIDPEVEQIVMKLLEKNAATRYQSMDDLQSDLIAVQSGKHPRHSASTTKLKAVGETRDTKTIIALVVCVVAVVILGTTGFLVFTSMQQHPTHPKQVEPEVAAPKSVATNTKLTLQDSLKQGMAFIDIANLVPITAADLPALDSADGKSVTQLSLLNGHFDDKAIEPVSSLTNLRYANLEGNQLANLHALKNLDLAVLNLRKNAGLNADGMHVISTMQNLNALALDGTPIKPADLTNLKGLKKLLLLELNACPNLKQANIDALKLDLPQCAILFLPQIDTDTLERGLLSVNDGRVTDPRNADQQRKAAYRYHDAAAVLNRQPNPDYSTLIALYTNEGIADKFYDKRKAKEAFEQAIDVAEKHLLTDPFYPLDLVELASLAKKSGEIRAMVDYRTKASEVWSKQIFELKRAQAYRNFVSDILNNQIMLCLYHGNDQGDVPEAEKAYALANKFLDAYGLQQSQLAADIQQVMGNVYFRAEKYLEAQRAYTASFENFPSKPPADRKPQQRELIRQLATSMLRTKDYTSLKAFAPIGMTIVTDPNDRAQLEAMLQTAKAGK